MLLHTVTVLKIRRAQPVTVFLLALLWLGGSGRAFSQVVPHTFANNAASVQWLKTQTTHFKIVFPGRERPLIPTLARQSERIYQEYKQRLGTAPSSVTLYFNDADEMVSGRRALEVDDAFSIWTGDLFEPASVPGMRTLDKRLRLAIGQAFQEHIQSFPIDYVDYLFARSSKSPWSDGLASYLAEHHVTAFDISAMRNYWGEQLTRDGVHPPMAQWADIMLGRSQIHHFIQRFSTDPIDNFYSYRKSLLGIRYFDFNPAFEQAAGISYEAFQQQWWRQGLSSFRDKRPRAANRGVNMLPGRTEALSFLGAVMQQEGGSIATVSFSSEGSTLQQLRVTRSDGSTETIQKGYFHPAMDWHPTEPLLAYAQNIYGDGHFYSRLYLANTRTAKSRPLTDLKNVQLPAFSPNGGQLALVQQMTSGDIIWLQNREGHMRRKLYTFSSPRSVTFVDYHPGGGRLLVSYRDENGIFRTGILHIEKQSFHPLSLKSNIPPNARWGARGDEIFYNAISDSVPNIFRIGIADTGIAGKAEPVTANFYGMQMADVVHSSAPSSILLAIGGGTFSPGKVLRYTVSPSGNRKASPSVDAGTGSSTQQKETTAAQDTAASPLKELPDFSEYNAFENMRWEPPTLVPYYLNPHDFGLGGMIELVEPMRTHELDFDGFISLPDPWNKSFFYAEYTNNALPPRLKLQWNHLASGSVFFGTSRQTERTDVLALTSLWKLGNDSRNYRSWYAGFWIRHLNFDYYPATSFRRHHPDLFFSNAKARQTDVKLMLSWRSLEPSRHTFIHPSDGEGVRFSITAADRLLGSQVRYARFSLDGYTVLPGFNEQRIFLYGHAALDRGEPTGRDYLSFSDDGDYQMPEENFMGSVNPGIDRFVRGYQTVLPGDRFLFGTLEYRIPLQFETNRWLLGILPPARSSLTFFTDGGVMGNARVSAGRRTTRYRYSAGLEIKRVLAFGDDFKLTYELGMAQPLNKPFGPVPYYNIKTAIPF